MKRVLSRHRLPRPYRAALALLWFAPVALLLAALLLAHGMTLALFDPRLLLPLLLLSLPALYVWQEGVDVLEDGLVARIHLPRYYPYQQLSYWRYDAHPARRVLTIWRAQYKALECRAGHLSDFPLLLRALEARVRGDSGR
ncbi:MAG: hypothetical protein HXY40_18865 [Chloroflexi bacterium]|nr:hypothetical protein [Chloroflexota bacterium]